MLVYVPLLAALAVLVGFALVPYSDRLDEAVSRVAFLLFRGLSIEPDASRDRLLRTAAIGTPYREYVTRTRLYVVGSAGAMAVIGASVAAVVIEAAGLAGRVDASVPRPGIFSNAPDPEPLVDALGEVGLAVGVDGGVAIAMVLAAVLFGAVGGATAYLVRWKLPEVRAAARRRQIDAGMPRMVAFVYALSRGGMSFPDVMRALSRTRPSSARARGRSASPSAASSCSTSTW